jgi:hypothetical protein
LVNADVECAKDLSSAGQEVADGYEDRRLATVVRTDQNSCLFVNVDFGLNQASEPAELNKGQADVWR